MEHDAFAAGVEPGGLWKQTDIRILLCYLLSRVGAPLPRERICQSLQEMGLANYFEIADALAALTRQGNLQSGPDDSGEECCAVTPAGREIARDLETSLPPSVRDKALSLALRLMGETRARRENRVELLQEGERLRLRCVIGSGDAELMSITLPVADRRQAELVEEQFYRDPEGIYRLLLAALTGDKGYARAFLEGREE